MSLYYVTLSSSVSWPVWNFKRDYLLKTRTREVFLDSLLTIQVLVSARSPLKSIDSKKDSRMPVAVAGRRSQATRVIQELQLALYPPWRCAHSWLPFRKHHMQTPKTFETSILPMENISNLSSHALATYQKLARDQAQNLHQNTTDSIDSLRW